MVIRPRHDDQTFNTGFLLVTLALYAALLNALHLDIKTGAL